MKKWETAEMVTLNINQTAFVNENPFELVGFKGGGKPGQGKPPWMGKDEGKPGQGKPPWSTNDSVNPLS